MYIKLDYEQEFYDLWQWLKSKYPEKLFNEEGIGDQIDVSKFSKKFFSVNTTSDASIDSNANVDDISVIAYNVELPKPYFKLNSFYMLWRELKRVYNLEIANKIIEHQLIGDIYINDFWGIGAGLSYCFNYSCYDIMQQGLPMIKKIKSLPPKYLYSFKSQLEQFTIIAANSTLGATGIADMLLIMSYYVKNILLNKSDGHFKFISENDCIEYIIETLTSFIYTINQPLRGNQSCFTNVSIYDKNFIEASKEYYVFPDGTTVDFYYVNLLQKLFLNIINKELKRTPLTFPVISACFSINENNEIQDVNFLDFISEQNKEFGFINIYAGKTSVLSSCCRLRSDTDNEYFNSFGSGTTKIGSLGVCSINFPRLAFKHNNNENVFFEELKYFVDICAKINNCKRKLVQKRIDNNNHPLYSLNFINLNKQYSTVGINGFAECVEIMKKTDITTKIGTNFGLQIIDTINEQNEKNQKKYKYPHNCEQIPAENVSIKLATKDKIMKYQDNFNIYSNQFIPLIVNTDMLSRIRLQGVFDKKFSGGSINHINVEDTLSLNDMKTIIKYCINKGNIYFAINHNLQECIDGHISVGTKNKCVVCNKNIVNNYTRVVGFLTNTKNWHKTRREEDYPNRKWY